MTESFSTWKSAVENEVSLYGDTSFIKKTNY